MECIKCAHPNGEGQQTCEGCGLNLATLQYTESGAADPVYDRYLVFRNAVRDVLEGRSAAESFKRFLDEESFKMAQKEQEIRQLEIPPDALEEFREELEVGFEGIELYNKALFHFRQFSTSGDGAFARSGLDLAWAGNEKINEARRLNRKNRAATPDEAPAADGAEAAAT